MNRQRKERIIKLVKNRQRREQLLADYKDELAQARRQRRTERDAEERKNPELKAQRQLHNVPATLELKRIYDETIAAEIEGEDEFFSLFAQNERDPKVLVTTSPGAKKQGLEFAELMCEFLPNNTYVARKPEYLMREMAHMCSNRHYSDLVVINEDRKKVTGISFIHLPEGPSFYFSVTLMKSKDELPGHGRATGHIPELILNNFNTRLGKTVGRLFQAIFPKQPELEGRQVITLHNQRDYIFFRRHRYVFRSDKKVGLQELGPQFTLKLRRVQRGIRGEVEWEHRPDMEKDRKKFYL